jgi:hypothetical protein
MELTKLQIGKLEKEWSKYLYILGMIDSPIGLSNDEVSHLENFSLTEGESVDRGWVIWEDKHSGFQTKAKKGTYKYLRLQWIENKRNIDEAERREQNTLKLRNSAEVQGNLENEIITGELAWCPICGSVMSALTDENGVIYKCYVCGFLKHESG